MANMFQEGIIDRIFPSEKKTDKFTVREFWLTIDGKYPETVQFQTNQDRCDLLDKFTDGASVRVHFDLRGRKWESQQKGAMVFNTLNCWKIESVDQTATGSTQNVQQPQPQPQPVAAPLPQSVTQAQTPVMDGANDLPF